VVIVKLICSSVKFPPLKLTVCLWHTKTQTTKRYKQCMPIKFKNCN